MGFKKELKARMDERWDGHYNLHYMITCFNADAAFYNCPDIVITPPGTAPVTNIVPIGECPLLALWCLEHLHNNKQRDDGQVHYMLIVPYQLNTIPCLCLLARNTFTF